MRTLSLLVAVVLGLTMTGLAGPAQAADTRPTISSVTPDPVPSDGVLTVTGAGCAASAPISFFVWQTTGGGMGEWNNTATLEGPGTGYTADPEGDFSTDLVLRSRFVPTAGSQLGVAVSCTPTYDSTQAGDSVFVLTALPSPTVAVSVPARVGYGAPVRVTVRLDRVAGNVTLKLDGTVVDARGSAWGDYTVTLPGTPALGAHALEAVFDPDVDGAPTVTGTATFTVVKASARVKLKAAKKRVAKGKKAVLKIRLVTTGPATGKVRVKDGATVRKAVRLVAGDHGVRRVKVELSTLGKHKLRAFFAGNGYVLAGASGKAKVTVVP